MKFEVLPNKKKRVTIILIIIGLITIVGIATFSLTRAKYQYTKSIPLIRASNISYSKSDLEIVAIKLQQDDGTYKDSNTIPQSGYIINEKETSCRVKDTATNVKFINIDGVNYIAPTEKGTKCSLVFDKKTLKHMILADNGGESAIKAKGNPDFSKTSCKSGTNLCYNSSTKQKEPCDCGEDTTGMWAMEDDYGTSYYFRGSPTNNYVKFGKYSKDIYYGYYSSTSSAYKEYFSLSECQNASSYNSNCSIGIAKDTNMYWRIIRINGDGTIRMIYDGTEYHPNGTSTKNSIAISSQIFKSSSNNNAYVGYTYATGSKRGTGTSSNAKTQIDKWYTSSGLSNYSNYLADSGFCGDRTSTTTDGGIPNNTGATGTTTTYYGAYYRLHKNKIPTLKCSTISYGSGFETGNKADAYTISSAKGNGQLQYPIGLISADEAALSGAISSSITLSNNGYYLHNGYDYWTMTPSFFHNLSAYELAVIGSINSVHGSDVTTSNNLRPVINLDPTKINNVSLVDGVYVVS